MTIRYATIWSRNLTIKFAYLSVRGRLRWEMIIISSVVRLHPSCVAEGAPLLTAPGPFSNNFTMTWNTAPRSSPSLGVGGGCTRAFVQCKFFQHTSQHA